MVASGKAERWYGSQAFALKGEPWIVYRLARGEDLNLLPCLNTGVWGETPGL